MHRISRVCVHMQCDRCELFGGKRAGARPAWKLRNAQEPCQKLSAAGCCTADMPSLCSCMLKVLLRSRVSARNPRSIPVFPGEESNKVYFQHTRVYVARSQSTRGHQSNHASSHRARACILRLGAGPRTAYYWNAPHQNVYVTHLVCVTMARTSTRRRACAQ